MQTHQFFFFEKEKRFGGMRGFDIARTLAGDSHEGIMLDSVVWDILEGKRLAVKNIATDKVCWSSLPVPCPSCRPSRTTMCPESTPPPWSRG